MSGDVGRKYISIDFHADLNHTKPTQSEDWTIEFNNDFAEHLCTFSLPPTLTNHCHVLDNCGCCTILFDLSGRNTTRSSAYDNHPRPRGSIASYGPGYVPPTPSLYETEGKSVRLSDIRKAAEICRLCKFVLHATTPYNDSTSEDLELYRDGATLRMGRDGPRISRLCADAGQFCFLLLDG